MPNVRLHVVSDADHRALGQPNRAVIANPRSFSMISGLLSDCLIVTSSLLSTRAKRREHLSVSPLIDQSSRFCPLSVQTNSRRHRGSLARLRDVLLMLSRILFENIRKDSVPLYFTVSCITCKKYVPSLGYSIQRG